MDTLTREPIELQTRTQPRRKWLMLTLCLLVVAAIGAAIAFWPKSKPQESARTKFANLPIPVVVAPVEKKDVPIYLDGLGTVQAFYTVTVKPMVDGPLTSVNFREGQDVHKGDVLAEIDPRTYQAALDQAVAKKAQDEATLANARLDLARYQKLAATNYTTTQQADTQKAMVAQLEAQVRGDQAQIDNARTQLSYCTITAPIDGRTGIRQVDAGNIVHPTDANGLVVITELRPISVLFNLPQQTLPAVTQAMRDGSAKVLAYAQDTPDRRAPPLDTGTLTVLENQVDPTTGTIKLKATFPNADGRLWPGGFVGVRLQVDTALGALVVPPAAIQRGPDGTYVFVIDNNAAKRLTVQVGHEDVADSIVTQGLQPGQQVVLDGAARLSDGKKVTIVQPVGTGEGSGQTRGAAPGTRRRAQ